MTNELSLTGCWDYIGTKQTRNNHVVFSGDFMQKMCRSLVAAAALLGVVTAHAATYYVDSFSVTNNGASIINDNFDDDVAPPSGPNSGSDYAVFAATLPPGVESGGKLALDPLQNGVLTTGAGATFYMIDIGGIYFDRTTPFSVTGVFDLVAPPADSLSTYGVYVTDVGFDPTFGALSSYNSLFAEVNTKSDGVSEVVYGWLDVIGGTATILGATDISIGAHSGIALTLSNEPGTSFLSASYQYHDGTSAVGTSTTVGGTYAMTGNFSVAGMIAAGVPAPVPEPETYALMMAGLGVLGAVARKKKKTAV